MRGYPRIPEGFKAECSNHTEATRILCSVFIAGTSQTFGEIVRLLKEPFTHGPLETTLYPSFQILKPL